MKKVLMITYYFPPVVSVGTLRALKFAKYLPKFGWRPIVLTVKNRDPFGHKFDYQFIKEKLGGVSVFRSYGVPLALIPKGLRRLGIKPEWFVAPDEFIGWLPHSFLVGRGILKREKIDAIYATSPPVTSLLIGAFLSWAYRKPLLVDFRDLWVNNPFASYPSKEHYNLERKMEEWVLRKTEAITVISKDQKENLIQTFPFLKGLNIAAIPNGYDPEDFRKITPQKFDKFTMLHAGSIYGPRVKEFKLLLEAVSHLIQKGDVSPDDFQLIFMGYLARDARKIMDELKLSNVLHLAVKPYNENLGFMSGSDVLVLIPGSGESMTAKIFEYLATGNFILNISNPGDATSKLISEMKAGKTVKADLPVLQEAIYKILKQRENKVKVNSRKLDNFSRLNLTKKLASVLDLVYEPKRLEVEQ